MRDWIVYRTLDNERHLWQIVETLEASGHDHIVVSPVGDSSRTLFAAGQGDQIEALYYRRIVPAKYYLDVLGLYLLNLLVANSSITTNKREKIDVDDLGRLGRSPPEGQPGIWAIWNLIAGSSTVTTRTRCGRFTSSSRRPTST